MVWFSTEIAIVKNDKGKLDYMIIDYVNDQCDMTPVSQTPSGIPNNVAFFTAQTLIRNFLKVLKNKKTGAGKYNLHLR
jgi:hypothetical protein